MSFGTHTDRDGRFRRVSPPLTKLPNIYLEGTRLDLRDTAVEGKIQNYTTSVLKEITNG